MTSTPSVLATGVLLCIRAMATSHSAVSGAEREEQSRNVDQRRLRRSEPRRERSLSLRLHLRGFSLTLFANPWRLSLLLWPGVGWSGRRLGSSDGLSSSAGCLCHCSCPDVSESSQLILYHIITERINSLYTLKINILYCRSIFGSIYKINVK